VTSRKRMAARRVLVAVPAGLLDARLSALDRLPAAAMFGVMVLASAGVHVLLVRGLDRHRDTTSLPPTHPIRVTVAPRPLPPPPPKPAEVPVPLAAPLVHRRVASSRPAAVVPASGPPPEIAPSPDNSPAPEAPLLMPGVALSATSVGGTMKVGVGGSPRGAPGGVGTGEGPDKAYRAREFAEAYGLTEEPAFLDNVSAEQVRRFYPEEARREKIEATVRAKLLVDDDGSVVRVTIIEDPGRGFGKAAAKLARLYRFKPAKVDGRAVATEIVFAIHFELD
jgi:protein TonB